MVLIDRGGPVDVIPGIGGRLAIAHLFPVSSCAGRTAADGPGL